ncbi:hypothetical protein HQ346_21650 [Rhodococcus sp. BP-252]|uniref:hypothetical protein n=1 Tax=unclassified Rhodococcus (in: high G+C Gram-positive bacteria) TaxID=192944 RepID=UPI001C9AB96B|nr:MULTISPECIES: hypothetical protein [unclassified Rhodococcus (in: high G+C Gram-positive bacteria)]MBY6414306.1 hypothetical protein [Rhodococcus sp. BP-320]MBY6419041.1 hypothetical protein [Rhodococcus sp. BP-321]MBY6423773.1 hypothetical protein [Rhodococcus sp. BP-324]MBY6429075.1 hypothetical protein [Rhodococcus sp. BP-323]MBY6434081.1 hypothetical protein [Rhodococcus sp. BP-322]
MIDPVTALPVRHSRRPYRHATQLTLDENELLLQLHKADPHKGNASLQKAMGVSSTRYERAKGRLLELGLAKRGMGSGGSLLRIDAADSSEFELADPVLPSRAREARLYEPLVETMQHHWGSESKQPLPLAVDNTAAQGQRRTGGRWSRPDIVLVQVKQFEYVPGTFLEVQTFEVKPFTQIDVLAVYEALAHRRVATHSSVALQVPAHLVDDLQESVEGVLKVAESHGVGVLSFARENDYTTWRVLSKPTRWEPDPESLNDFIDTQLPSATKDRIRNKLSLGRVGFGAN